MLRSCFPSVLAGRAPGAGGAADHRLLSFGDPGAHRHPSPGQPAVHGDFSPKNGAFYDGTSGLGSTCMEAGRYAAGHGGGLNIFAQEKLDVLCAVSTVRAYLNGLEDFTVRGGDVLTAPAYTVGNTVASFDYSVMFPPLGLPWGEAERELAWDKYRRFSGGPVPRSNAEWLFVQHQLASLRGEGAGELLRFPPVPCSTTPPGGSAGGFWKPTASTV